MAMIMQEGMEWSMGSEAVMSRLSELLFIYALRQYLEENPEKVGFWHFILTHGSLKRWLLFMKNQTQTGHWKGWQSRWLCHELSWHKTSSRSVAGR